MAKRPVDPVAKILEAFRKLPPDDRNEVLGAITPDRHGVELEIDEARCETFENLAPFVTHDPLCHAAGAPEALTRTCGVSKCLDY